MRSWEAEVNSKPACSLWIAEVREAPTDRLYRLLAEDEQARCRQFRRSELRELFIVAHALKRICIANCLGTTDPRAVMFATLGSGKPTVANAPLHFNLSHSHGLCALAVSELAPCGVDIEVHGAKAAVDAGLMKAMTVAERQDISDSDHPYRTFVDCWVVKEAYAKCTELGLAEVFAELCTKQECHWTGEGHGTLRGMQMWRKAFPTYSVAVCLDSASRHCGTELMISSKDCLSGLLKADRYEFHQSSPGRERHQTDRSRDELQSAA
jgi:phosphopantetheinyl transferase